jgi:hypothetical protein
MSTATAGALAVISYPSRVYVVCDIQSDDSEDSNRLIYITASDTADDRL